jgi:drug/metabolite transporter (DMT)-like permease
MGAIGYIGQSFAYLTALQYASPGLVALLLYLYPIFVTALAALVLHEPITRAKAVALGLAVVGLALTVGPEGGQSAGILLAIGAAAIYSIYILVGNHVLKQVSASLSSAVIFASAGLSAGVLMLLNGPHFPASATGWWAMAGIVVLATVLPVITFLAGLERIGPTRAAMLSVLEPVVTVLLAAWWLGTVLSPAALIGGGLILTAVLVLTRGELRRPAAASAME